MPTASLIPSRIQTEIAIENVQRITAAPDYSPNTFQIYAEYHMAKAVLHGEDLASVRTWAIEAALYRDAILNVAELNATLGEVKAR